MNISRRHFAVLSATALTTRLFGQGVAPRSVKPEAKPAPSGCPFNAHFTDVAREAGLTVPVIYGKPDFKEYILEAVGCGCAFIDYDNDGWMDIFLLCGTTLEAAPAEATNRLYKNNRDGTFTDVTDKAGLRSVGWASAVCAGDYNNDGFEDLFVTYFGQNKLYRNNGDGTFSDVTKEAGLFNEVSRWGAGCTFVDYNRDGKLISSSPTTFNLIRSVCPNPARTVVVPGRAYRSSAVRGDFLPDTIRFIAITATALLPM